MLIVTYVFFHLTVFVLPIRQESGWHSITVNLLRSVKFTLSNKSTEMHVLKLILFWPHYPISMYLVDPFGGTVTFVVVMIPTVAAAASSSSTLQ